MRNLLPVHRKPSSMLKSRFRPALEQLEDRTVFATHFSVTGFPLAATTGVAENITVRAANADGSTDPGYSGTVHFASTDPFGATLPADYTFTAADAGVHTFAAGATLFTAGSQTITVSGTGLPAGAVSAW
jgi:hypothetical protein